MLHANTGAPPIPFPQAALASIAKQRADLGEVAFRQRLQAIGRLGGSAGKGKLRHSFASARVRKEAPVPRTYGRARRLRVAPVGDGTDATPLACLAWIDRMLERTLSLLAGQLDRAANDAERREILRLYLDIRNALERHAGVPAAAAVARQRTRYGGQKRRST